VVQSVVTLKNGLLHYRHIALVPAVWVVEPLLFMHRDLCMSSPFFGRLVITFWHCMEWFFKNPETLVLYEVLDGVKSM
jgi:hypothetical protein